MQSLTRAKLFTALSVAAFLIVFEYVRHVLYPQLLHSWPAYLISVATVAAVLLLVNEWVFSQFRRLQNNYVDAVVESSGNSVIIMAKDGTIERWNRAAEEIYGWGRDEVIGRSMPMVPDDLRDEARRIIDRLCAGETIRNLETRRLRKDGEVIPVLLTASPILDERGNVTDILGISTDLRERKRLERELLQQQRTLAALQERERLARELHDGLGQVLGFVNTQSQAVREFLARGQTDAALQCLKELTEVSQDAHADVREYILGLKVGGANGSLFQSVREYLRRFSSLTGIGTDLQLQPGLSDDVFDMQHRTQLLRIIQEALTNARKHAHARSVAVSFTCDADSVTIDVVDDGTGFNPAQISQDEGRQFGLRIMRDRAADIGGTVSVHSAPGCGTRVSVRVPAQASNGIHST